MAGIMIYNRQTKELYNEIESDTRIINFLYNSVLGRVLLKIITQQWFSRILSKYYKSKLSRKKIKQFIYKYNIDNIDNMGSVNNYKSFNDFFIRQKDYNITHDTNDLISPAESKLTAYKIDNNLKIKIKNTIYSITDLIGQSSRSNELLQEFKSGICLVFRLSTTDYHRYIHIDNGHYVYTYDIPGILHTVRSISEKYKIYVHNHRVVSVLSGKRLGRYIQIEIGALTIGKIVNNNKERFTRGEEKGYFEYGGSTIVILFRKNSIEIDQDISFQNSLGNEIKIDIGEKIGTINKC